MDKDKKDKLKAQIHDVIIPINKEMNYYTVNDDKWSELRIIVKALELALDLIENG